MVKTLFPAIHSQSARTKKSNAKRDLFRNSRLQAFRCRVIRYRASLISVNSNVVSYFAGGSTCPNPLLLSCRFCSACLTPGTPETKQQTPYGSLMTSAETPTQHRIIWDRARSYRVSRRDPLVGSRVPLARSMALRCVGVFGQLERGALVSVHPDEARSSLFARRY